VLAGPEAGEHNQDAHAFWKPGVLGGSTKTGREAP
jgi:hypothetical protein